LIDRSNLVDFLAQNTTGSAGLTSKTLWKVAVKWQFLLAGAGRVRGVAYTGF